jgi:hypothetical protein
MRESAFVGHTTRRAAVAAALGFGIVAVFQLLLALGAPWGQAAWGGGQEGELPQELRFASTVSMVIYIGAAFIVLGRAGYWGTRFSELFRRGTWVLAVLLAVGAVMNAASPSIWERFMWAPVALLLALACLIVARGSSRRVAADA